MHNNRGLNLNYQKNVHDPSKCVTMEPKLNPYNKCGLQDSPHKKCGLPSNMEAILQLVTILGKCGLQSQMSPNYGKI